MMPPLNKGCPEMVQDPMVVSVGWKRGQQREGVEGPGKEARVQIR